MKKFLPCSDITKTVTLLFFCLLLNIASAFAQGKWKEKAGISIRRLEAIGFSIGSKGYLGTGYDPGTGNTLDDFWEYDPATDSWTQKASVPGGSRKNAIGLSIGSKGYVLYGIELSPTYSGPKGDFWEYDPDFNIWTQISIDAMTSSSDALDWGSVGFTVGVKAYFVATFSNSSVWEFDPLAGWSQKGYFPGQPRRFAVGFGIGDKGYMGTGQGVGGIGDVNDFWEYNPASDSWAQKASLPGVGRGWAVGFSIEKRDTSEQVIMDH